MREIKFRGQRQSDNEWIYGDLLQPTELCDIYEISDCESIDGSRYDVIRDTIGQYTGLKDKNGKEIYEGDILKYMAIADGEQIDAVIFDRGTFVVDYAEDYKQPINEINHCSEVIGNIYDNPELLEKG